MARFGNGSAYKSRRDKMRETGFIGHGWSGWHSKPLETWNWKQLRLILIGSFQIKYEPRLLPHMSRFYWGWGWSSILTNGDLLNGRFWRWMLVVSRFFTHDSHEFKTDVWNLAVKTISRVVADVWKKDVWEFQAWSGSSGPCRLFLHFLGKIAVQEMSGRTPGSPRHPSSKHPQPSELGPGKTNKQENT